MSARPGSSPIAAAVRPSLGRLAAAILLGAGALACAVGLAATSGWLISRSAQRPQEPALALAIVAVQFFALGRGLLRYCERLVGHDAALRVLARLRVRIYEALERLAPAGLPMFRRGELLTRLVHDVDSVQDLLLRVIAPFAIAVLVGAAAVVLAFAMLPAAGVALLVALLLAGAAVPWLSLRLAERSSAARAEAQGRLTAEVLDLLAGAPELAVNGAAAGARRRVAGTDARLTELARSEARTAGVGSGLTSALGGAAMWSSLLLGAAAVADGHMHGVLLAGLALIPLAAFELVTPLPAAAQALQASRRSAERLRTVTEAPLPVDDEGACVPAPNGPFAIELRGVRCRYPGQSRWALDGVDLDLPPGAKVALVGASGAGKTTVGWLLLRFLAYEGGSASIDGAELDTLDGDAVRRVIGMVEQEPHIFDSTVAANLRLARPEACDEELEHALARVRLDGWVATLPDGLDSHLGERGARMSGGQRQRLALARALLADFPVLVLDEPTEHLDGAAARAVLGELLDAAGQRSTLLITHVLAGLEDFDEIVVLDRGLVLERGRHPELLAGGGRYAELWREQARPAS